MISQEKKAVYFLLVFFLNIALEITLPTMARAADFSFEKHWNFPIQPQGPPPENFSDLEASLDPEDCGTCHEAQYEDWKTSLHSKSMGPGVTGQFHPPWLDQSTISICGYCHSPLAEQSPFKGLPDGHLKKNPEFSPELRSQGIVCAGCHTRRHVRYGPTPLAGKVKDPPHNSFVEVENFGNSEFCKPCHQFQPQDRRLNDKLLQNTYEEWKNSSYSKKGIQCANCHMPDRKHLWRGIHDKEMVEKGISIQAERKGSMMFLKILNSGVGHNFPSYVTPKIVIRGVVIDKKGKEIPETVQEKFIGWYIKLNLSDELYDTRIPPGGEFNADFNIKSSSSGEKFSLVIQVYPDDFYNRFFKSLLDHPPEGIDLKSIKKAYEETLKSSYVLFEKNWDI